MADDFLCYFCIEEIREERERVIRPAESPRFVVTEESATKEKATQVVETDLEQVDIAQFVDGYVTRTKRSSNELFWKVIGVE